MGWWKRLFGRGSREQGSDQQAASPRAAEPAGERARAEAESPMLDRLRRLGQPGGADLNEALHALQGARGTPAQSAVLAAILRALRPEPAHDPLRVACAQLLAERGQPHRARQLAAATRSTAGLMLAAELYAAEGDLARAISLLERVLARDIDAPGARERHQRWSAQLGRTRPQDRTDDGATVLGAASPEAPFRLLREVARGGAGTIYQAEDEVLGRVVAFKVYHRRGKDREQVEREARMAVRFAGPSVVRIFDANPPEGWLVSEWLPYGSLRDRLRADRVAEIPPLERWFPPLLEALARVHEQGFVHADLKPANVLFRSPAEAVLSDFGICQPIGAAAEGGTMGYLSAERLAGEPADPRDDVYAAGRIIEDVLAAREAAPAGAKDEAPHWAELARQCLRELDARPADGRALLAALQARD